MLKAGKSDFKERFANSVKYIWAMRSTGKEFVISHALKQFHLYTGYARIVDEITGQETDVPRLCEEMYARVLELNRVRNIERKVKYAEATEKNAMFNPEEVMKDVEALVAKKVEAPKEETSEPTPAPQEKEEVDISRLRCEIRQEILEEMELREQREFRYKREKIAIEVLCNLASARPKEMPEALANKAVAISDCLLKNLNNVE